MTKKILKDIEYFHNDGKALSISDIIDALQDIKDTYGDINICILADGILKVVAFIQIITTVDKSKRCALLEP